MRLSQFSGQVVSTAARIWDGVAFEARMASRAGWNWVLSRLAWFNYGSKLYFCGIDNVVMVVYLHTGFVEVHVPGEPTLHLRLRWENQGFLIVDVVKPECSDLLQKRSESFGKLSWSIGHFGFSCVEFRRNSAWLGSL